MKLLEVVSKLNCDLSGNAFRFYTRKFLIIEWLIKLINHQPNEFESFKKGLKCHKFSLENHQESDDAIYLPLRSKWHPTPLDRWLMQQKHCLFSSARNPLTFILHFIVRCHFIVQKTIYSHFFPSWLIVFVKYFPFPVTDFYYLLFSLHSTTCNNVQLNSEEKLLEQCLMHI